MKKMPLLIIIPLIAVLVIVSVAMGVKVLSPKPEVKITKSTEFPNPLKDAEVSKPSSFLGGLFGQKSPTPSPTPATASDLSKELKNTYDDGGQADLDALNKDAATL